MKNQIDDILGNIEKLQITPESNNLRFEFVLLLYLVSYLCMQYYSIIAKMKYLHFKYNLTTNKDIYRTVCIDFISKIQKFT